MTRAEWDAAPLNIKLRMLNNIVAEMNTKSQQVKDLLSLLEAEHGPFMCARSDRMGLADRQQRVVALEIGNLWRVISGVEQMLTPKFDESPTPQGG